MIRLFAINLREREGSNESKSIGCSSLDDKFTKMRSKLREHINESDVTIKE